MRTLTIDGATTIKYNIIQFENSKPLEIKGYNASISSVRAPSKSGASMVYYKPTNIPLLNPFTTFENGKGYVIAATNNFIIPTDAPEAYSIPDKLSFQGDQAAPKYTIFRYPFTAPVNLKDYPAIVRAETLNKTKGMFKVYTADSAINPFSTLEPGVEYVILSKAPFEILNPVAAPAAPTPTPTATAEPTPTPVPTATPGPTPLPTATPTPTPTALTQFSNNVVGPNDENVAEAISITGFDDIFYFNNKPGTNFDSKNMTIWVNNQQRLNVSFTADRLTTVFGYTVGTTNTRLQTTGVFAEGDVYLTI